MTITKKEADEIINAFKRLGKKDHDRILKKMRREINVDIDTKVLKKRLEDLQKHFEKSMEAKINE